MQRFRRESTVFSSLYLHVYISYHIVSYSAIHNHNTHNGRLFYRYHVSHLPGRLYSSITIVGLC